MSDFFNTANHLLDELIEQQRSKLLRIARELKPSLTLEDILNPQTFPELVHNATFNYEDGILAGLMSAQMALRAEWRKSGAVKGPKAQNDHCSQTDA